MPPTTTHPASAYTPSPTSADARHPPPFPISTPRSPRTDMRPSPTDPEPTSPYDFPLGFIPQSFPPFVPFEARANPPQPATSGYMPQRRASGSSGADSRAREMVTPESGAYGDENGGERKKDVGGGEVPPWSELKTKAGKERKRLPLACIACRRKKIRCSGEKPACKHCLRSRIPCVYKVTTRKAAPRTDYMAMLDKRLKRMEERVIKLIPKGNEAVIASVPRAVLKPAPAGSAKSPGRKRAADEAFGHEGELDAWAKGRPNGKELPIKGQDSDEKRLLVEGAEALPSKEIQMHLAEVYFEYVYGQAYPLLHKPSFLRKLAAGTVPPVLILAVCAIAARFSDHPAVRTEPAFLRGENWASVAREIALKRYDTPNITILLVYILLGLHEFGTCQGGRSWMFGGMAQRMAFALQLHMDLDHKSWDRGKKDQTRLTPTDREIRRRTMWSCYLMDRFNSSGTDRPMQMADEFVNIPLPIKESYFQMEVSGPTETLEGKVLYPAEPDAGELVDARENMGAAAYIIRLVSLWGRVVRYWNLGGREAEDRPIWATDSEYHALRKAILEFRDTLPESLRYNADNLRNHTTDRVANQFIFMHLVYNQLVLFMSRFSLPLSGRGRIPADMPADFLKSSAHAALDAANQISALIKEATEHAVTAPFAGYCAFYSSTVHIYGVFSKNAKLEMVAKQNLAHNVRYLSKMKKYWGMFHFVAENLKDLYRQHADAAHRGSAAAAAAAGKQEQIFQYGDWFDRYPHGVSQTDYEDPASDQKLEPGGDAVLGEKSALQSVEEFFATLEPPVLPTARRGGAKKAKVQSKGGKTSAGDGAVANMRDGQASEVPLQSPVPFDGFDQSLLPYQTDPAYGNYFTMAAPGLPQAAMLSQLDRHMVLASYAGMDPASAAAISNTMSTAGGVEGGVGIGMPGVQQQQQQQQPVDLWNIGNVDLSVFGSAGMGFGGANGWSDPSTAWFMPWNLAPPENPRGEEFGDAAFGRMGYGGFGGVGIVERMQGNNRTGGGVFDDTKTQ
ncbi:hypothetical protein EJ06DRAFT_527274 [Trichodelitschia bisporula]|uniref:Zn(2)-C6 fungal-type domain-containing protein n=1 Tax=Trichodelitschia bisporula TaxID=703511 RepID=A0A6G1I5Y3_9PEZI|nr:hypothetical protein EJ06DRAFT_527274 [Trichodelitschia bisporula]